MQPKPTFTGRPRRRKAHPWVKASDAFARFLITMGGIGTIAAVLSIAAAVGLTLRKLLRS
jgi:hypothetical protein